MSERWLVLAGPTRTGTTALFRHLAQSASLRASRHKETDYFLRCLRRGEAADLAAYRQLFAAGAGRRMEASPLYFANGAPLAAQIAALPGDVKVLLTLREPVARFRSLLLHVQTKRNVSNPPAAAEFVARALAAAQGPGAAADAERNADWHDDNLLAFREGCYAELLAEWVAVLGESRVRVVFFESLAQTPAPVLLAIYRWLELPADAQPALQLARENAAQAVRWRRLHALALALNARLEPLLNRLAPLRAGLRALYYRFNGERTPDPLPAALAAQLQQAYAARNAGLRAQVQALTLGPLPDWVASP